MYYLKYLLMDAQFCSQGLFFIQLPVKCMLLRAFQKQPVLIIIIIIIITTTIVGIALSLSICIIVSFLFCVFPAPSKKNKQTFV